MGLFNRLLDAFRGEQRAFNISNQGYFDNNFGSSIVNSRGVAMSLSSVTACVRTISTAIASLPLNLYTKEGDNKSIDKNHILYKLVHSEPNENITSYNWRVQQMMNLLINGNCYSLIVRNTGGVPVELIPLDSENVRPIVHEGHIFYEVTGESIPLNSFDVLHISGLSFDGVSGYSPLQMYAKTIGLGVYSRDYASNYFSSGGNIGGLLKTAKVMKPEVIERIRYQWNQKYSGLSNSHSTAVLPEGMEYQRLNVSAADSDLIKQMEFTREEIASIFAVPPSQIGIMRDSSSRANVEEQSIMFYRNCLLPYLVNWEQELNRKLLRTDEKNNLFFEFNASGILRGDIESRYNSYAIAIQNGWLNRNEVRELENLNSKEGLSEYLVPLNMADATKEEIDGE